MKAFNICDPDGLVIARAGTRKAAFRIQKHIGLPGFTIEPMCRYSRVKKTQMEIAARVVASIIRQISKEKTI